MRRLLSTLRRLRHDSSGLAMLEFAFTAPILIAMALTGSELTNYIITRMRMSQLALHIADNAARIGTGPSNSAKVITETDVNDLLTGANLQSGELQLLNRGRVIISDIVPVASPNTTNTFRINWQRCKGSKTYASSYGVAGATNLSGVGPTGQQVGAPDNGATMFVELYYEYDPLIQTSLSPSTTMVEVASMVVRDARNETLTNPGAETISSC